MISLRNRLLFLIGIAEIVLLSGTFVLSYDKGKHEAQELLDGQLVLSMRLIEAQIHHDPGHFSTAQFLGKNNKNESPYSALIELINDKDRSKYEPELAFSAWDAKGLKVLRSNNAEAMQLLHQYGFSDLSMNGRQWRAFTKRTYESGYQLQVAHPMDTRDLAGLEVAQRITFPLILSLPLLLIAIFYAIQFSLKPVNRLANIISRRSGSNLNPIETKDALKELVPVVVAFNQLLSKMKRSLENEKKFTADAAHELRSPLAGLKVQAQVAFTANDPVIQRRALSNVLLGVQRSERLVEQLLRLARLDPEQNHALQFESVNLKYLILEALDATQAERSSHQQEIKLDFPKVDLSISGDHDLLLVLTTNILSNAIKYSPTETNIYISICVQGDSVLLQFRDQGPGIPEQELPEITNRFRRGKSAQGQGSGLGLAIVERISDLHHAILRITNHKDTGLVVSVYFPLDKHA
jgi:two-component system sensor histidine kinase QseC